MEGTAVVPTGLSFRLNHHWIPEVTHPQPEPAEVSLATRRSPVSGIFQVKLVLLTCVGCEISHSDLIVNYPRTMRDGRFQVH